VDQIYELGYLDHSDFAFWPLLFHLRLSCSFQFFNEDSNYFPLIHRSVASKINVLSAVDLLIFFTSLILILMMRLPSLFLLMSYLWPFKY
jgi:hypothetical protein